MGKGSIYTFPVAEDEGGRRVGDYFDNNGSVEIYREVDEVTVYLVLCVCTIIQMMEERQY